MSKASAKPPRRKRRPLKRALPKPPGDGWWGKGAPPWERWPGVTIKLECVWNPHTEHHDTTCDLGPAECTDPAHEIRGRWESPCGKYWFDQQAGDKAVEFFPEFLVHHIGEHNGKPFVLLDYQELLQTRPLFGWMRVADGTRRFRNAFIFVPKGAGKSPWGAGTAIYLTACDNEPAAEVYVCAGDKFQARVVHDNAKIMVEESQELDNIFEVLKDSIYDASTRSKLVVLSSDAETKHGFRPHGIVFDEFHNQPNRDLYEALEQSMRKRRQPLLIITTHAGDDDEGICYEEYEMAKAVLSGTSPNDTTLPVIFEAKPEDDWKDPEVWKRVNPAHGVLVKHDAIANACINAQIQPRKRNDFLRFTLNRWVGQAVAWLNVDQWDAGKLVVSDELLSTLPVASGLDMAQKWDLASFVAVFKEQLAGPSKDVEVVATEADEKGADRVVRKNVSLNYRIHLVPFFWIPDGTLKERPKQDQDMLEDWAARGFLKITEGNSIDYDVIFKDINGPIAARFPRLRGGEVRYDPAFATEVAQKLMGAGFVCVETPQNYKHLSEPAHIVEALLRDGRLNHSGHPVLRWNAENVAVKRDDAGRIRPVKSRRTTKRIDGIVAALMGINGVALQGVKPAPSVYVMGEGAAAPEPSNQEQPTQHDFNDDEEFWP